MICKINFSVAIELSGKDIQSIRKKFETMPLFHPEIDKICEFNDIEQVVRVDDDSYDDFTSEFNHAYDKRQDSPDVL